MNTTPQTLTTPYQLLGGGDELVRDLVSIFYSHMAKAEIELAKTHPLDENGLVASETQQRFALFLIQWLGGAAHTGDLRDFLDVRFAEVASFLQNRPNPSP